MLTYLSATLGFRTTDVFHLLFLNLLAKSRLSSAHIFILVLNYKHFTRTSKEKQLTKLYYLQQQIWITKKDPLLSLTLKA